MPSILIGLAVWNSDKVLSKNGAEVIYGYIHGTSENPSKSQISKEIELFLDKYFSINNGMINFSFNVFKLTCLSLFLFLSIYASKTEGLYSILGTSGFLSQFIFNGFVVTYLTNFFIFLTYSVLIDRFINGSLSASLLIVVIDQFIKVMLFLILTAITYMWFADFRGAFGGSRIEALKAIPVTVTMALKFQNLTSVYIYSFLLSSFPLFIVLIIKIIAGNVKINNVLKSILFWLPFENKPLRFVGSLFALFCGIFAGFISIVLIFLAS